MPSSSADVTTPVGHRMTHTRRPRPVSNANVHATKHDAMERRGRRRRPGRLQQPTVGHRVDVDAGVRPLGARARRPSDAGEHYTTVGLEMDELSAIDTPWTIRIADADTRRALRRCTHDRRRRAPASRRHRLGVRGWVRRRCSPRLPPGEEAQGSEPIQEYEGVKAEFGGSVAARDDRLLVGSEPSAIEPIVRVREGDADRLPAASDPGERLLSVLPVSTVTGA